MRTPTADNLHTQIYRIFIRATAEQVWRGITDPAFIAKEPASHVTWEIEPVENGQPMGEVT